MEVRPRSRLRCRFEAAPAAYVAKCVRAVVGLAIAAMKVDAAREVWEAARAEHEAAA